MKQKIRAWAIAIAMVLALFMVRGLFDSTESNRQSNTSDGIERLTPEQQQLQSALKNAIDLPPDHSSDAVMASENPNDPYAAEQSKVVLLDYRLHRAQGEQATQTAYFALGCQVLGNDMYAYSVLLNELQSLQSETEQKGISDNHIPDDLKAAGQSGIDRSKKDGACDYWHQHPDATYQIRQLTQASVLAMSH